MKLFILLVLIASGVLLTPIAAAEPPSNQAVPDPIPVSATPPMYPQEALMRGTQGWVRLGFNIDGDGGVTDVRVIESEPGRVFVASARRALEKWRFDPTDAGPAAYTIEFKIGSAEHDH